MYVLGLPLHPLAVHAPIILVPLLALAAVAYALVPRIRHHVAWAAVALAVAAPGSAILARFSGVALAEDLFGSNLPAPVDNHMGFGNLLMWSSIGLGVLTLVLVWLRRREAESRPRAWLAVAVTVLVLVAAAASSYYIFRVGDSGATMVWENRV